MNLAQSKHNERQTPRGVCMVHTLHLLLLLPWLGLLTLPLPVSPWALQTWYSVVPQCPSSREKKLRR